MRYRNLLAPILALVLTGCSLYDPPSGQKKEDIDDQGQLVSLDFARL